MEKYDHINDPVFAPASKGDLFVLERKVKSHDSVAIYEQQKYVYSLLIVEEERDRIITKMRDCRDRIHDPKSIPYLHCYMLQQDFFVDETESVLKKYLEERNGQPFESLSDSREWLKQYVKPEHINE